MQVIYTDNHRQHDPQRFLVRGQLADSAEKPARADILLGAARAGGHLVVAPDDFGLAPIAAVHTPEYLDFLQNAHALWQQLPGASAEVMPNIHPARRPASYPSGIVARAGWHQVDGACPIGAGTWAAACAAAQVAATAAQRVIDGAGQAYALCRPPGHHAFADMAGGFCFLNNTAIAAQFLRRHFSRVAVFDIDVHHGNGTQAIFYSRRDVLTVSIHADPNLYYPYFWGHAHERGEGEGEGCNLNLPLPLATGDQRWLATGDQAIGQLRRFAPDALVVALGLDASASDPLQGLTVSAGGFAQMAAKIAALDLPTVLVQEGGYLGPDLGTNWTAFIDGFTGARAALTRGQ